MSTVMHPRGPLPARVYWTRRLLIVLLVVVVLAVVWWLLPGGSSNSASADPGRQAARSNPAAVKPLPRHPGDTEAAEASSPPSTRPARTRTSAPPASIPTGPCDPASVALSVDVGDAQAGAGNTVRLKMASADGSTCSLGITPSRLEIEITSGTATVWQSSSCPDGLAAKNVVVRPQPAVVYSLTWDGRITSDACSTKGKIAAPGGYWVEAALIGGAPHKSYFAITAPHLR